MATKSAVGISALFLAAAVGAGCTVTTSGAQCNIDGNCQTGQRCAVVNGSGTCEACTLPCPAGFTCGTGSSGSAACICPPPSGAVYVDAAVSSGYAPTGAQTQACRFKTLTAGLAAAVATGIAEVTATGWTSGNPMIFSDAAGETLPLVVPQGVTLNTDSGGVGHYAIQADQTVPTGSGQAPIVQLGPGSSLSGFAIQVGPAGVASDGVVLSCGAQDAGASSLSQLVVNGAAGGAAPSVQNGVRLEGACSAELKGVEVEAVAASGVLIQSVQSAVVSVAAGTISSCGQTGLVVRVQGGAAVSITDNTIKANSGTTKYGLNPDLRTVGGVLFDTNLPASLTFTGNLVFGNKGDQVMVNSSTPGWNLSGGASCSASSQTVNNVIACYDPAQNGESPGVGLSLVSTPAGSVDAYFEAWANSPPKAGTDFRIVAGGTLNAIGASGSGYCPLPSGFCQ